MDPQFAQNLRLGLLPQTWHIFHRTTGYTVTSLTHGTYVPRDGRVVLQQQSTTVAETRN